MSRRDEFRKKVSAAFKNAIWDGNNYGTLRRDQAWDAAINIVLEEAAKMAEAFSAQTHGNLAVEPYAAAEQAADEIAAAIRKLGEQR